MLRRPPPVLVPALFAAGLASWTDENGVQWLLAPSGSPSLSAGFKTTNGAVANGAIVAWKMAAGPKASLEPAWVSRDMIAPLPPIVVNGVIFAVASGEYHPGDPAVGNADRARPFLARRAVCARCGDRQGNLEQRHDDDLFRAWHGPVVKSRTGFSLATSNGTVVCVRDAV